MDYAVISINKQQYLVKPGDKIPALGIMGKEGGKIKDVKVLLYKDGEVEVGTPYVDKTVDLTIKTLSKTEKVDIFKYKSKSRYRRHTGHRQDQTILEVAAPKSTVKTPKAAPKKAAAPKKK